MPKLDSTENKGVRQPEMAGGEPVSTGVEGLAQGQAWGRPSNGNLHLTSGRLLARNAWSVWIGCLFFGYILYLPVTQNVLKACLICAVLALLLSKFLVYGRAFQLDGAIASWTAFYACLGGCYILYGLILGAPGALFSSFVYLIYPVVYTIFIAGATQARIWTQLLKVIPIATIAIGVGTIEYVLWSAGLFPDSLFINPGIVDSITFYPGYVQMSHFSLSSLIFLVPFLVAAIVVYGESDRALLNRKIAGIALTLGIAVAVLGGRRALLILVVLAPFLTWVFRSQLPEPIKASGQKRMRVALAASSLVLLAAGLLVIGVLKVSWSGLVDLMAGGFDFEFNPNAIPRTEQFFALLRGWWAHPLFGNGLGSYTTEVVRNNRLWEYELQYVLLLFQTGAVGALLYSSGVVWLYWKAVKIIRSGSAIGVHMVPVLVGTTCIIVANSADPYLQTFGHLWMIFLPVGLINWYEISEGAAGKKWAPVAQNT